MIGKKVKICPHCRGCGYVELDTVKASKAPGPKYTSFSSVGGRVRVEIPAGWHRVYWGNLEAGDQTYWHNSTNPPTGFHSIDVIPPGYASPPDKVGKDVTQLHCVIRKD